MELCLCGAWKGGEFGWRMDICTSMAEFLCCSLETITTLLTGYTPIQNKELKKNKIKLPCDLAIPLLDIYLEKTIIQKESHAP